MGLGHLCRHDDLTHSLCGAGRGLGKGAPNCRSRQPAAITEGQTFHAGGQSRNRQRISGQVDRLYEAAECGGKTLLSLSAVLDGAFSQPAVKQFAGKSRIGQYGDKLMEGDYHVGQILDTLKELGVDDDTLLVFASDNGPPGETLREMATRERPTWAAGSLPRRTRRSHRGLDPNLRHHPLAGHIKPDTTSYAMFSIMDFFPTFATIIGGQVPTDRPIDGVDQIEVLLGRNETGKRDSLLTFIGADLMAVRWKQWRVYFTDVQPTGIGPQRQPGHVSASAPMAGYPKIYNIQMDPHEDLQVGALFGWTFGPMFEVVERYLGSLKQYPNPPAPNITNFTSHTRPSG